MCCGSADAAALLTFLHNNAILQSSAYTGGIGDFACSYYPTSNIKPAIVTFL